MNRRDFVEKLSAGSLLSSLLIQHKNKIKRFHHSSDSTDYWQLVKDNFPIANRSDNYLHLNSGSVGTMSKSMMRSLQDLVVHMNEYPPYEALTEWNEERALLREKLSQLIDGSSGEIAIIRNTTEGVNTIINGIPCDDGDEIICANHDYPHSLFAVRQRCDRDGLVAKTIQINLLEGDDHIVEEYVKSFGDKTRYLLLTHITHRQGYIMPIKKIVTAAKQRNIEVILDAAHTVGHIDHSIRDLGVDYYVSSLHKWLNAPHSTGLLWAKKEKIRTLRPLMACDERVEDKIVKFEYIGTRTFHQEVGILFALAELEEMTIQKKEERLKYLTNYWVSQAKHIPGFIPLSSYDENKFGAVWTFALKGIKTGELKKILKKKYTINTKSVGTKPISGLRISTNIYHLESDLDKFVFALNEIAKSSAY